MNTTVVRNIAIGASIVAAAIYLGIGIGVLDIGGAADGSDPGLFEFGVLMAAISGVTAALLWFVRSRVLWIVVAATQVIVLLGYVAFAPYREPAFEAWGIAIKIAQAVVLGAMVYLLAHRRESSTATVTATPPPPPVTKGHVA